MHSGHIFVIEDSIRNTETGGEKARRLINVRERRETHLATPRPRMGRSCSMMAATTSLVTLSLASSSLVTSSFIS